jgi:hypothetical protein
MIRFERIAALTLACAALIALLLVVQFLMR